MNSDYFGKKQSSTANDPKASDTDGLRVMGHWAQS
jgi:hypothetical protein